MDTKKAAAFLFRAMVVGVVSWVHRLGRIPDYWVRRRRERCPGRQTVANAYVGGSACSAGPPFFRPASLCLSVAHPPNRLAHSSWSRIAAKSCPLPLLPRPCAYSDDDSAQASSSANYSASARLIALVTIRSSSGTDREGSSEADRSVTALARSSGDTQRTLLGRAHSKGKEDLLESKTMKHPSCAEFLQHKTDDK
jgi:hypothetical protein